MPDRRWAPNLAPMKKLMLTRTSVARSLSVCAAVVLLGSVAACGGGEPTEEPDSGPEASAASAPSSTEGDAAGGFCEQVDGIGEDLALLKLDEMDDPAGFPGRVSQAAARFAGVEPPEQIAESWQRVGDFLALADEALRDVEVTNEADIEQALNLEGEAAFAMVLLLPGQVEAVGVYVQETCQVDLGITPPAIGDVCAVLDPVHLQSVFDGGVPEGENRRWGEGTVECTWDDGDDHQVGVVVMPAGAMNRDLLDGASQVDTVQMDGSAIDVYDGAFGPFRAAGGRTAATVVGDTGVLASVRTGDAQAEALKAVALVGLVATDLG